MTMLEQEILEQEPSWATQARCLGDREFLNKAFSENVGEINEARAFCCDCSVKAQCLSAAVERSEPYGVWGGEFLLGGSVAAKRSRGRPSMVGSPPISVDMARDIA